MLFSALLAVGHNRVCRAFLLVLLCGKAMILGPALSPAFADEVKSLPSDLALVPTECPGFVSIAPREFLTSDLGKQLLRHLSKEDTALLVQQCLNTSLPPDDLERLTLFPGGNTCIVRTKREYERSQVIARYGLNGPGSIHKGWSAYPGLDPGMVTLVDQQVFLRGRQPQLYRLLDWQDLAKDTGTLKDFLPLAAGKHFLVVGLNPRTIFKAEAIWQMPAAPGVIPPTDLIGTIDLPPEGKPFAALLQARSLALLVDVTDTFHVEARLAFATDEQASAGEKGAREALETLTQHLERLSKRLAVTPDVLEQLRPVFQQLRAAVKEAKVRKEGRKVIVTAQLKPEAAFHAAITAYLRERVQQIASAANLKKLALAMQNFSDAGEGYLPPPAILNKQGKPLLSWRVALLPMLGEEALYKEFHLDEPWDSAHNKKLLAKMPKVYAPAKKQTKDPFATCYQVFVGPNAPFQIKPEAGPLGARGPQFPASFLDGTSNTFLIVEAAEAVPWTKPVDLAFDEKKPVPKLGGQFALGFHAVFADGSVRFLRPTMSQDTLKLLINPADGMVIPGYGEIVGGLFPLFEE